MLDQDINRIVDDIIARMSDKEHSSYSSRVYSDRPLIQTGKQMREREQKQEASASVTPQDDSRAMLPWSAADLKPQAPSKAQPITAPRNRAEIPEVYSHIAAMAANSRSTYYGYGSRKASELFYRQAKYMEDWEDDYNYTGSFVQYYPTYQSLSLGQLRGYFTWRARVRKGEMPDAPLPFAYLLAYELLCGIGTMPGEQGFQDLVSLLNRYITTPTGSRSTFNTYLDQWISDYTIFHALHEHIDLEVNSAASMAKSVNVLKSAQFQHLKALGVAPKHDEGYEGLDSEPISAHELFEALNLTCTYNASASRFYKDCPQDYEAICEKMFKGFVEYCARRRKTDFVEGLFGSPGSWNYTMFQSAVFYGEHDDCTVELCDGYSYTCFANHWIINLNHDGNGPSRVLGDLMRACDQRARAYLGHPHPLKPRPLHRYEEKLIDAAIVERMAEVTAKEQEKKRAEVKIDFSNLDTIRAAAESTREALLVDEEREDEVAASAPETPDEGFTNVEAVGPSQQDSKPPAAEERGETMRKDNTPVRNNILSAEEYRLVEALISGAPLPDLGASAFISVMVDSINDKLFDLIGDTVIELDGDAPVLVEDYLDDLKGALFS